MKKIATYIIGILVAGSTFAHAQDCNPNPPDDLKPLEAYSLFSSNFRNKDYDFALKYGRWMMCSKPKTIENYPKFDLSKQYERFIKIYEALGNASADPEIKVAYYDTVLTLYEDSFTLFTDQEIDKFELRFDRGRFYQQNTDFIEGAVSKAITDYETLFETDPKRTTELGEGYYVQYLLQYMVSNGEKEKAQAIIETAKPYANETTLSFFDDRLKDLIGGSPEERLIYYQGKVEADPGSVEDLEGLADAQEDLDMRSELIVTKRKIHELKPTFASALSLADLEKGNARYSTAANLYKEALNKAVSDDDKKEINLDLADVYSSLEQLKTAKSYVQAALRIDPKFGLAYIKMATIYGQAVSQCTSSRKLEAKDKVVYWVVVDYLQKAKNVDRSVANAVNTQLGTYQAVTPSTEDKFFTLGYKDGQKVKVDGSLDSCYEWINETTTVR